MTLKSGLRRAINRLGWDVRRRPRASAVEADKAGHVALVLAQAEIGVLLDVGANKGQFALGMRAKGYKGRIVSFEPLSGPHEELTRAAASDPSWDAHPRCAVGDREDEIEINVSANLVSSSVLPMADLHVRAAYSSRYAGVERAPMRRLDSIMAAYDVQDAPLALKMDVQGFESQVLDGAPATLARARAVVCELSVAELYGGQTLWRPMIDRLEADGLELWALQPGFTEQSSGRTLQLDAIFLRPDA